MTAAPFYTLQGRGQLEVQVNGRWLRLTREQVRDIVADLLVLSPQPVHDAVQRIQRQAAEPGDVAVVHAWVEQAVLAYVSA